MASLKGAIAAALLLAPACMQAADYAIGADVSFMRQAEQRGIAFSEAGKTQPALAILHAHGYAWIRLRLFHSPTELPNDLDYTIALAAADTNGNAIMVRCTATGADDLNMLIVTQP